jgi:hypothetical protein
MNGGSIFLELSILCVSADSPGYKTVFRKSQRRFTKKLPLYGYLFPQDISMKFILFFTDFERVIHVFDKLLMCCQNPDFVFFNIIFASLIFLPISKILDSSYDEMMIITY